MAGCRCKYDNETYFIQEYQCGALIGMCVDISGWNIHVEAPAGSGSR